MFFLKSKNQSAVRHIFAGNPEAGVGIRLDGERDPSDGPVYTNLDVQLKHQLHVAGTTDVPRTGGAQ